MTPQRQTTMTGRHSHHASTLNHCREQLLAGWERLQVQNGEDNGHQTQWNDNGTTRWETTGRGRRWGGNTNEKRPKRHRLTSLGPLVSLFLLISLLLFLLTDFFRYYLKLLMTTTRGVRKRGGEDAMVGMTTDDKGTQHPPPPL